MRPPLVLMYHGVDERHRADDPENLFVRPDAFAAQLETLLRAGWTPLDLDAYLARLGPSRGFLVTFDDGYVSVGQVAAPILAALSVPALCFVCPARLGARSDWSGGRPEPLLDPDGVRGLGRCGIEVGAHGLDHTALPGLTPAELRAHTAGAADGIALLTGTRPRAFAYPYGTHDSASRLAVARAGYAVGFATYDGAGPTAVPRVDVNALDTARSFHLKTWRGYPVTRQALSRAPGLRAGVHALVGRAARRS